LKWVKNLPAQKSMVPQANRKAVLAESPQLAKYLDNQQHQPVAACPEYKYQYDPQ
jgi:hypothetical protein